MIESLASPRVRVPAFAIGALGLLALGTMALPRIATPVVHELMVVQAPAPVGPARPLVTTQEAQQSVGDPTKACGAGAYVTGDMAGAMSPATVYATMCGSR
ncbi:MAG TPA: hypothetical protein VGQ62_10565 [Chloroflexota bacterium]|jgi:hypothetical protein|nr:hypothetical protein [Chloroflexota bacterium]